MDNNDLKKYVLTDMISMLRRIRQKYNVLNALDCDTSEDNSYDLNDQLTSMITNIDKLGESMIRANSIIPKR